MNRLGRLIIPVLMAVFLVGCQDHRAKTASLPSPELEQEEYNVYSFLVNSRSDAENESLAIISDSTVPVNVIDMYIPSDDSHPNIFRTRYYLWGFFEQIYIAEIGEDTLEDFEQKNQHHSPLNYKFNIKRKYLLLSHEEYMELVPLGPSWHELHSVYPNSYGVFSFSRVGFNRGKSKAIVYQGWWEGCSVSFGYIILLYKVKGVWIIERKMSLWG